MKTSSKLARRNLSFLLIIALIVVPLAGCGEREEALAVADAGIATANSLATFYDALADKTTETYRGQVYLGVLRGTPTSEATLRSVRSVTRALKLRAKAAKDLASLYASLKKLSSYNASAVVQTQSTGLVKDLLSLPQIGTNVDAAGIAGKILGGIAAEKQSRNIREAATLAHQLLKTIMEVFKAESAVTDAMGPVLLTTDEDGNPLADGQAGPQLNLYANIVMARNLVTASVVEELVRSKVVVGWQILERYPLTLGLPFSDIGKKAVECPVKTATNTAEEKRKIAECEAVIAVFKSQLREERLAASSVSTTMAGALNELDKAHNDLLHKQGISLKQWQFLLTEAESYISELQKLKDSVS
jgi:hypothetical protein